MANVQPGPLSHIRVLDLSRILAGPWASQILGDLGADVVKVERPETGDDTRHWGPPYLKDKDGNDTSESAYYLSANRNKRSVCIDITTSEGQDLIRKLVGKSDVVIENFKVGGLKKYGLDYDSLKAVKPDLVYCSISGFGQTGPYANRAGYDFLIQGMGGLMSVTGKPDDVPGGGPVKVGVALADVMTGLYAAIAIQAALTHRDRTGEGQKVNLSLLDVQVATLANQALNFLTSAESPQRMGNAHPNIVPYQTFATADGHMILAIGNDSQFQKFCILAGCAELAMDERFSTNAQRVRNRDVLSPVLADLIVKHPLDWWIDELERAGVPGGPINTIDRVFDDPQVRHQGLHIEQLHPLAGTAPGVASPMRFSKTPVSYDAAAPTLGQHTDQVLRDWLDV